MPLLVVQRGILEQVWVPKARHWTATHVWRTPWWYTGSHTCGPLNRQFEDDSQIGGKGGEGERGGEGVKA